MEGIIFGTRIEELEVSNALTEKRIEENFLCRVTFTVFSMLLIEIIILNLYLLLNCLGKS